MILSTNYNPDVLTCLANLSNDEVFTPPQVVNRMLDMLPAELFRSKDTKFLDPVSKSGVFLREIAKRLMIGLESQIPDIHERADHIFTKQLFGIAITELTALTSRRSVYCSKYANSEYSICRKFKDKEGNLRFNPIEHKFVDGKCKYCGASESVFGKKVRTELESHAYEFIHTDKPEKIFGNMKFDVIIGNPPYQLNDGGHGASAIPIYQHFVEQAKKLNPRYLTMIIPARWYAGGRGLDDFRETMISDPRIRNLVDYFDSTDCFPGIDLSGGICYFLWSRDYNGETEVVTNMRGVQSVMQRPLKEPGNDSFIRFNEAISILRKIQSYGEPSFKTIVSSQKPFGFRTFFKGHKNCFPNAITIYTANKEIGYVSRDEVSMNEEWIDDYKVFISRVYGERGEFPYLMIGKPFVGEPNTCCTETYIVIGPVANRDRAENIISYLKTKFLRFLVLLKKNTQDAPARVYQFVPLQDFSHPWTDEMLYKKYGLANDEIAFIESMIRPME